MGDFSRINIPTTVNVRKKPTTRSISYIESYLLHQKFKFTLKETYFHKKKIQ